MIKLPELPYKLDALAPSISERTLNFHYNKHHATYVDKTNELIKNTLVEDRTIEDIIKYYDGPSATTLFNNAAQVWNHTFYWNSMIPTSTKPTVALKTLIEKSFESIEGLKQEIIEKATTNFGSGWTWLIKENDKLKIVNTNNAKTPLTTESQQAILVIDVWEHAYYLDYQNERKKYVEKWWELINWDFAAKNAG